MVGCGIGSGIARTASRETREQTSGLMAGDVTDADTDIFFAFVAVLALIGVAAWLVRRFATNRLGANTNRGRMPRLAVIDAAAVDGRRRLVLVRRDNVEHLLMIGGPTDIVVEPNIVRAMPGRGADAAAPAVGGAEPPPRIAPLPDAGWSDERRPTRDRHVRPSPSRKCPSRRRGRRVPPLPTKCAARRRRRCRNGAPIRRRALRRNRARSRRTWPASRRSRWAAGPSPARELRPEPMPSRVHLAQRAGDAAPAAARTAEGAAGPCARTAPRHRRRRPRRRRLAPRAVERRPESRRDGAAAGSSPAPAGRRTVAPPVAPEPPQARARRAASRPPPAPPRRRAALKISKTRWRPCWAVQRTLREAGGILRVELFYSLQS